MYAGAGLNRNGFTLMELFIVFIVIGLLASIVLPQVQRFRYRAMESTLKSDLRTLAMHEESHYYDWSTYTDDLAVLAVAGFSPSPDINVVVNEATFLGWSATVQHVQLLVECYMFVGNAAPVGTAVVEGGISCS
jgi:prepilin-type N-terminal cleavage/methylation domain-containing protein